MLRRFCSSWRSAPEARALLALAVIAVVTLPGVTRRIYASDEVQYVAFLRSLWFDGDVSFDNEYRQFYATGTTRDPMFAATFIEPATATGLRRNFGTIGSAILWAPFYAAADAGVRVARAAGSSVAADGYSAPYISAICIGSAVYGLLALLLAWSAARRVLDSAGLPSGAHTALAAAAAALGTPLLFYMYIAPGFAHATSAFAVAAFVLAWVVVRERWSLAGLIVLGALAGLMAMVREQDAFVVVGPALDLAWAVLRNGRVRAIGPALAGAAAAILVYLPQAAAYLAINGRLGPSPLVSRKMTWTSPHAAGVLFSPEHGLFFWTPLALLAVAGLLLLVARPGGARGQAAGVPGAREASLRIGAGLVAIVLAQVYIAGSVESWTVAGAFGQRRFVAMTSPFVIGLSVVGAHLVRSRARAAASVLAGLCVWWNLGLMVQFGAGLMDRQRLDLPRNAYNTFVEVPRRLPDLAYRYVFDRGSFYRHTPPGGPS
ncbi:MAG: hypothetical protein R6V57_07780 [Vicinamibacterales bacterium]